MPEPHRAKVILTRTVTEIAIVLFDRFGEVEEIMDVHEELEWDDCEVHSVIDVNTVYP